MVLQRCRGEAGREEEAWQPEHRRRALLAPAVKHVHTRQEVLDVAAEGLEAGIALGLHRHAGRGKLSPLTITDSAQK